MIRILTKKITTALLVVMLLSNVLGLTGLVFAEDLTGEFSVDSVVIKKDNGTVITSGSPLTNGSYISAVVNGKLPKQDVKADDTIVFPLIASEPAQVRLSVATPVTIPLMAGTEEIGTYTISNELNEEGNPTGNVLVSFTATQDINNATDFTFDLGNTIRVSNIPRGDDTIGGKIGALGTEQDVYFRNVVSFKPSNGSKIGKYPGTRGIDFVNWTIHANTEGSAKLHKGEAYPEYNNTYFEDEFDRAETVTLTRVRALIYCPLALEGPNANKMSNRGYSITVPSTAYSKVNQNPGESYEDLKDRLAPFQYAVYEDGATKKYVFNNGDLDGSAKFKLDDLQSDWADKAVNYWVDNLHLYDASQKAALKARLLEVYGSNNPVNGKAVTFLHSLKETFEPTVLLDNNRDNTVHITGKYNGVNSDFPRTSKLTIAGIFGGMEVEKDQVALRKFNTDGDPIVGAKIKLEKKEGENGTWEEVGTKFTNEDGDVVFGGLAASDTTWFRFSELSAPLPYNKDSIVIKTINNETVTNGEFQHDDEDAGKILLATNDFIKIPVSTEKTWNTDNYPEGFVVTKPAMTFELWRRPAGTTEEGEKVADQDKPVPADGGTVEFGEHPKYVGVSDVVYEYFVKEVFVENAPENANWEFIPGGPDVQDDSINLSGENKFKQPTGKLTVKKFFENMNNQRGPAGTKADPPTFQFKITGPYGFAEEFPLKAGEEKVFENLPFGEYKVEETDSGVFESSSYDLYGDNRDGIVVLNEQGGDYLISFTNKPKQDDFTVDVDATKTWVGAAHLQMSLVLYRNGDVYTGVAPTITSPVQGDGNWVYSYKWEGLWKYDESGKEYEYTVSEPAEIFTEEDPNVVKIPKGAFEGISIPDDIEFLFFNVTQEGNDITNTLIPPKTEVEATKTWVDGPAADHTAVKLNLYRQIGDGDKESVDADPVVTGEGPFNYKWSDLDKTNINLEAYTYTVEENGVADGKVTVNGNTYEVESSVNLNGITDLTNTYLPGVFSVSATKTWVDGPAADHTAVKLNLYREAESTEKELVNVEPTVTGDGPFNYLWTDLDKTNQLGEEYTYTVEEDGVVDGEIKVNAHTYKVTSQVNPTGVTELTNIYQSSSDSVTGEKNWDNVPENVIKPTVWFKLFRKIGDGPENEVDAEIKELKHGTTSVTWDNMPSTDLTGSSYTYFVKEVDVDGNNFTPVGYEKVEDGLKVTNTNIETVSVDVLKEWIGEPAESVTVNLLADGMFVKDAELKSANNWKHTFKDLPKYVDGKEVVYTVKEVDVSGYISSTTTGPAITTPASVSFTITNTITGKGDIKVIKEWEGKKLDKVHIRLLASDTEVDSVDLKEGSWTHTFKNLDQYKNGKPIMYTVVEDTVNGYTTKMTIEKNSNTSGSAINVTSGPAVEVTITNIEKTYKLGDYVWYDDNKNGIQDAGEKGVEGVKVTLFDKDGNKLAETTTDANGKYVFEGLSNGTYTVKFSNLPAGYQPTTSNVGTNDLVDSDGLTPTGEIKDADNMSLDLGIYKTNDSGTPGGGNNGAGNPGGGNTNTSSGTGETTAPKLYKLGNYVWYDDNHDGVQDPTEHGVAGIKVVLFDKDGNQIAETVTDINGRYIFTGLANGEYSVQFSNLPAGYQVSLTDVGIDTLDSDGLNPSVSINNADNLTLDLGVYKPAEPVVTPVEPAEPQLPQTNENLPVLPIALGLLLIVAGAGAYVWGKRTESEF